MRWELIYIALWSQFKVQGFSRQEPFSSSLWEELNVNKYWWSRTNFADELPQFYFTSVIAVIYTNIRTVRMYVCMWIIIFRPSVSYISVRPSVRLSVTFPSVCPSVSYKWPSCPQGLEFQVRSSVYFYMDKSWFQTLTVGCTIFSKCSQIKPTFLHSNCIGEIRSHAKFQVSSFNDFAWPPLFSPAYCRTLETGVSVTDDDDLTHWVILIIVWYPKQFVWYPKHLSWKRW